MKNTWTVLGILAICALFIAAETSAPAIDEATARKLAIDQYNLLFTDKYFSDDFGPGAKRYHQFPKLDEKYFLKAELKDGCWYLDGDHSKGVIIKARVSADGKWVQLTAVGFAFE